VIGGGPTGVRVAIVQSAAMLLTGDEVLIRASVGARARLELVEIASTVAHPVRGGAGQRQRVEAHVAESGQLLVREQPLILAAECDLEREVRLVMADGATALWSEATVLGRHGEEPGRARLRLRVDHGHRALLDEELDTHARDVLRSALVVGSARAVGTVALLGRRDPEPPAGVLDLAGPGCLARAAGDDVRLRQLLDPIEARWRELLGTVSARGGAGRASLSPAPSERPPDCPQPIRAAPPSARSALGSLLQ
jgi:urease accessory protein